MPRGSRIDAAGAVHHIMVRGIERKKIFESNADRDHFLKRLGEILQDTQTTCFAWSLIPNHFHLLLRTGNVPISTVMRRLLTGYAIWYNRTHRRHGHLFQNRFKSILCQEDAYLLELVRYIHLNPLRARLVQDLDALDDYPYSGHSALMGRVRNLWQETEEILRLFGNRPASAQRDYRNYVGEGIDQGRRQDLTGGGLIRSAGGWEGLKTGGSERNHWRSDERILGDGDFVTQVLAQAQEQLEMRHALRADGMDLDKVALRVSELMNIKVDDVWAKGKRQYIVDARSLLCFWAVEELGLMMSSLGRKFKLSIPAISKSVARGKQIAELKEFKLTDS
ncbi:MAG: transposase [Deltaproteobacteria bacterium]|nr:transposase [Deltaproteobacteria bacterium]